MKLKHLIIWWTVLIAALIVVLGWQPIKAGTSRVLNSWTNTRGLVGFWDFDDCDSCTTAVDRSGNGNLGTLRDNGTPTNLHTSSGKVGNGASFNGINNDMNVPYNTSFNPTALTLSVWIKSTGANTSDSGIVNRTSATAYQIMHAGTGGAEDHRIYFAVLGVAVTSNTAISDNLWHFLTMTWDGSTITGYVDGNSEGAAASSGTLTDTGRLAVGCRQTIEAGVCFIGSLDEVRLYNRALSAAEVKALYQANVNEKVGVQQKSISKTGLVGFWNFDDCDSCTTAVDRSGNGNLGTMTNGASRTANGKIGNAGNFDGINDYVQLSGPIISVNGDLTLSGWINSTSFGSANTIISTFGATTGYQLGVAAGGTAFLYLGSGSSLSAGAVSVNQWFHIVGVSRSGISEIYVNGILQGSGARTMSLNSDNAQIGQNLSGGEIAFGQIDEVRVYNRALSAAEVKALYQDTRKLFTNVNQNKLINDDLLGFWTFNGPDVSGTTATDRGSGGNNGTLTNGPLPARGIVGQALDFDGTNDYIDFGDVLDGQSELTLSVWINVDSGACGDTCDVINKDNNIPNSNRSYGISVLGAGSVYFYVFNTSAVFEDVQGTSNLVGTGWHHIVGVYTGSVVRVYVDGVQENTPGVDDALTGAIQNTTVSLKLGWNRNGVAAYLKGLADEPRIYSRALSAAEISALYRAGRRD